MGSSILRSIVLPLFLRSLTLLEPSYRPTLPFISCLTLEKLLNFCQPRFPNQQNVHREHWCNGVIRRKCCAWCWCRLLDISYIWLSFLSLFFFFYYPENLFLSCKVYKIPTPLKLLVNQPPPCMTILFTCIKQITLWFLEFWMNGRNGEGYLTSHFPFTDN